MKICKENVQKALDPLVQNESLSAWDCQRIVRTAQLEQKRPRRHLKRLAMLLTTAVLCVACATGVLASVPGLAEKLTMLSRETIEMLKPIEQVDEDAGVRMEVVAAINDGGSAIIYVSLTDVTGENRLDDTTDAADITVSGLDYAYCDNVYHKQDGSVVLRIIGEKKTEDESLSEKKVTLSLHTILAGNDYQTGLDTGYTVADIMAWNPAPQLNAGGTVDSYTLNGGMDSDLFKQLESGHFATLKEQTSFTDARLPWVEVLNAGVEKDMLHILLDADDATWYNRVEFGLADENGMRYDSDFAKLGIGHVLPATRDTWRETTQREEQVLQMPEDAAPDKLHLVYDLDVWNSCITGNWATTFVLQDKGEILTASCDMDMQPWRLTEITVSAIGVELTGAGTMDENSKDATVAVVLADGTVYDSYTRSSTTIYVDEAGQEVVLQKSLFDEPLELALVESISVDGSLVWSRAQGE